MSEQLSAEEREALAANVCSCHSRLAHIAKILAPAVAQIAEDRVTARLAAVEALAESLDAVPDYTATDYDRGRVDQRHMDASDLYAALRPDPNCSTCDGGGYLDCTDPA